MCVLCVQRIYVQFYNIKFRKPKSQLLLGLEASFKMDIKLRMTTFISFQKHIFGITPSSLAYGLYTCENVDNYGWPLSTLPLVHNLSTFAIC